MAFDKGQTFVKFQALIEPLVLETVQSVEQAQMKNVDEFGNGGDRNAHGKEFALHQKHRLHHNGEDRVGDADREGGHGSWSSRRGFAEGTVGYVSEPDRTDYLGQKVKGQDPQGGKSHAQDRYDTVPKAVASRLSKDRQDNPMQERQQEILEDDNGKPKEAAIENATFDCSFHDGGFFLMVCGFGVGSFF